MFQSKPSFKGIKIKFQDIADSLKVDIPDIDTTRPQQIVSTGLFTLPINIKSLDILKNIKPDFEKISILCKKFNIGSFHLFSFETIDEDSIYHARNFAPLYGVKEDPVTGTANGAISSYLIKNKIIEKTKFVCEQGDFIGRPGRVFIDIQGSIIKVGGQAIIVKEKNIEV